MPHHHAITSSSDLGRGMSFTVQSGVLRHRDVIDLKLAGGKKADAVIERFDVTGLSISVNGSICQCRPWRMGDATVERLPGTISSWTIEQILEAVEDDVHA